MNLEERKKSLLAEGNTLKEKIDFYSLQINQAAVRVQNINGQLQLIEELSKAEESIVPNA